MPRRNENARARVTRGQRIYPVFLPVSESPVEIKHQTGTMKTTAEQIVRDFRRTEGFNVRESVGTIRPARRPFFLKRWIRAVNWELVFDWGCIGAVVACLIYLGIFVFGPFTLKLFR